MDRTHATVSYIESGKTELSYEDLRKVAFFFNMTVSELVEEKPQMGFQQNFRTNLNLSKKEVEKVKEALDELKKMLDQFEVFLRTFSN